MAEGLEVESDGMPVEVSSIFLQLKEAAERKDFIPFKRILDKSQSDLIDPSTGYYPIHVVFEQNFVEASRHLLEIDHTLLDKRDKNGNTPLHIACAKGHVNLIEAYASQSDEILINNEGHSLLHVAASASRLEIIRVLLSKGFDPYQFTKEDKLNCLHIASKKGNKDIVEYFINEVGMSPQSVSGANEDLDRPGGQQPIHFAALNGHLSLLKYLINEHKCNPNAEDNSGKTPAFYAGECGKVEVMEYLVEELDCDPSHKARATGKVAANRQAIHGACFSGSLPMVQYLIGTHVDPYATDGAKVTPLACAAQEGKLDIVRYLLQPEHTTPRDDDEDIKHGPDVQDATGRTPLHYACLKDRHEVVQFLCTDGKADVNLLDNSGETGLIVACKSGHRNIVRFLLIDKEYDEATSTSGGRRVIDFASLKNWLDIITHLVQNKNYNPEQLNDIGFSAIHYAAEGNSLPVLQYYLEDRKCDPNVMSSEGETGTTPLHRACMFGHFDVAQYLIKDRKCPLIIATKNKLMSPLHLACSNGHMNIVKFLIESCNHEIEIRNNQGALPLHMAILNGHGEVARYLIDEHKSDPTIMTKGGATGFHAAAQGGHLEVLIDLLEHPRFADFKNKLYFLPGGSPLDQAAEQGHLEIVKYLVLGGICNPRKRGGDNSLTCLHWAASKGRTDVVKFLVEEVSCDLLESTLNGELPLHLACSKGHVDTVLYLLKKDKDQLSVKDNNRLTPLQLASKAGITSKEVLCSFVMAGADPDQLIEVSPGNCGFMKSCIPLYAQTKVFLLGSSKALLNQLNSLEDSTVPLVSAPVSLSYKSYKHIGDVMLYAVSEEVISFDGVLCDALSHCSHPVFMICFDMTENKGFDEIGSCINYWLQFISSLLSYTANKSARPLLSVIINVDSKTDVELLDEVSTSCLSLSIPDHELVISPQVLQCDLDSLSPIHAIRLIVFLSKYCNALQEHRPLELFPTALRSFVLHRFRESSLERHTLTEISCEMIVEDAPLPTDIEKLAEGFTALSQSGYLMFLKDNKDIGESIVILEPSLTLQKTSEVISEIKASGSLCITSDEDIISQCSTKCALDPLTFLNVIQYMGFCINLSQTEQVKKLQLNTAEVPISWCFFPTLLPKYLPDHDFVVSTDQSEGEISLGWLLECEPPYQFPPPVCNLLPVLPIMCTDPPLVYCDKQNGCYESTSSTVQCIHRTTQVTLTHLHGEAILLVIKDTKNNLLSLAKTQSVIINAIYSLKDKYCPDIPTHRYLLHPSCMNNLTLDEEPSLTAISIEDIIQNIKDLREAFDCSIEDLSGFEPLLIIKNDLVRKLLDPALNKKTISDEDFESLVEAFAPYCAQLAIVLQLDLSKDLESDTERAKSVLMDWMNKGKTKGSTGRCYSDLWECIKSYSMFTSQSPPPHMV